MGVHGERHHYLSAGGFSLFSRPSFVCFGFGGARRGEGKDLGTGNPGSRGVR
jgi:hypothetical protein